MTIICVDCFPYTPSYTDVDSSLSSVSDVGSSSLPAWVSLNLLDGTLSGAPPVAAADVVTGPHKLRFFDGTNSVDSNEFSILVPGIGVLPDAILHSFKVVNLGSGAAIMHMFGVGNIDAVDTEFQSSNIVISSYKVINKTNDSKDLSKYGVMNP